MAQNEIRYETATSLPARPRDIRLSGAHGQPRRPHAHLDLVRPAVERRRREAQQILLVQLIGDAGTRQIALVSLPD